MRVIVRNPEIADCDANRQSFGNKMRAEQSAQHSQATLHGASRLSAPGRASHAAQTPAREFYNFSLPPSAASQAAQLRKFAAGMATRLGGGRGFDPAHGISGFDSRRWG